MKHQIIYCAFAAGALLLSSCADGKFDEQIELPLAEEPSQTDDENTQSGYDEQYRPQIHYTPAKNWINDPNGLVYANGVYHLYYQYNPQSRDWGNMSWGHATSTDLIKWKEQPVAMTADALGDVFSGSAVCDKDNTAGFGNNAIVAIYTANGDHQQQCLAYSTDGMTFTRYENNPVIANTTESDFRDPKVFWHKESKQWIMALAMGWKCSIEFWGSPNLKNWTRLSSFSTDIEACNRGQWECPDLIRMDYKGQEKWVLIVSTNPGGPVSGSGTQYFVGDFDGKEFVADQCDYPMWLDYGMDNYAGVTWNNVDDRTILIGWMNNWNYAGSVPASPWRSAMTLPRELKLIEYDGKPLLASSVVSEIETIAGEWADVLGEEIGVDGPYQLRLDVDVTRDGTITLSNGSGEYLEVTISSATSKLITHRTGTTGDVSFSSSFSIPSVKAPFNSVGDTVTLYFYVDNSSVEIFTGNGSMVQTNIVFPRNIYNILRVSDNVVKAQVRPFDSIWK